MNLIALLFVVVPGFLADYARRIVFGHRKASDFERTVLSLTWSAFGLAAYLAIGDLIAWVSRSTHPPRLFVPAYLTALGTVSGQAAVTLDAWVFVTLGMHTAFAIGVALTSVRAMRTSFGRWVLGGVANRTTDSVWMQLWSVHQPGADGKNPRWVQVITSRGDRISGRFISASDEGDARDVLLGDPLFWDAETRPWHG